MKQNRLKLIVNLGLLTMIIFSCQEEKVELPTSASIFYSAVDKKVAFTALTINADTYLWEFGDGQTSTDKDPVHEYESGGYYAVSLTVGGATGTDSETLQIAIALTPYVLLTGGPTDENGKTWKLTANHPATDKFADANSELSTVQELPQGAFDLFLGLGEVYDDEYTFHFDGTYEHDVKEDGAAFGGLVHQIATTQGTGIAKYTEASMEFGLCTAFYTPESGATFTYTENEDFDVPSVYGPGGILTYEGVSTFDFAGSEFIGFLDAQRKVMVQDIQDKSMQLVMFMSASEDYYPLATHALVLTFEVVE